MWYGGGGGAGGKGGGDGGEGGKGGEGGGGLGGGGLQEPATQSIWRNSLKVGWRAIEHTTSHHVNKVTWCAHVLLAF